MAKSNSKKTEKNTMAVRPTHIAVIQAGWVFIGTEDRSVPGKYMLRDAACIRVWGTEHGLGQLALVGPTEETILDQCGIVEVADHAMIYTLPIHESATW